MGLDDWYLEESKPFCFYGALMDLKTLSVHPRMTRTIRGIEITIENGQVAMSIRELAERWGRSREWATESVRKWTVAKKILPQKNNLTTIFTIIPEHATKKSKPQSLPQNQPQNQPQNSTQNGFFQRFWDAYPRKEARAVAEVAWKKVVPPVDESILNIILNTLAWQVKSEQWKKADGKFIPMGSTYINQRRWEDQKPLNLFEETEEEHERYIMLLAKGAEGAHRK